MLRFFLYSVSGTHSLSYPSLQLTLSRRLYRSCSTILFFFPGCSCSNPFFCKDLFPYLPLGPCPCSLYIPCLPFSLSHQIKSLRLTFKAVCSPSLPRALSPGWYLMSAPIPDQPPMPAPISQLLNIMSKQLCASPSSPSPLEKISVLTAKPHLGSL